MRNLNPKIPDKFMDVINMFKISNKTEIEKMFGKSNQSSVIQYIIYNYMCQNNLSIYVDMLKDDVNKKM